MAEQSPEREKPMTYFLMRAREEGTKIAPTIVRFQTVLDRGRCLPRKEAHPCRKKLRK